MALVFASLPAFVHSQSDLLKSLNEHPDYVNLTGLPHLAFDIRYASKNNFMGKDVYGAYNQAFLHKDAAAMLTSAAKALAGKIPGYKLLVFDGLRPRGVQQVLWDHVKGTGQQDYVANPQTGSIHNFGLAVDLSIQDDNGKELDMGTPYDSFDPLAQPKREEEMIKNGRLSQAQLQNRLLLRKVMQEAGFAQLNIEWWHFNARTIKQAREHYKMVE